MNRRIWAAVVLLACVTACTNSAGAPAHVATSADGTTSAPNRTTALSTAGGSSAATLQPTSTLSVPAPNDMVGGFGSLWVVEHHDSALLRINPATVKPVARIAMPSKPGAVVVALGKIWVEDAAGMTEVDPATNTVIRTVPFASACGTPAVLAHGIWLSNCGSGQLTEIDMGGKVLRRVPAGDYQITTVLTPAGMWVATYTPGEVLLIDPASGKTLQRQRVHGCPFFQKNPPVGGFIYASLFCDGGAAQEAGHDDELLKLNATTGNATIVRTNMAISGVEAGTRRLYLFNFGAGQIATFDPATGQIRGVAQAPGGSELYVTEFGGALWAILFDQEQLNKYPLPQS